MLNAGNKIGAIKNVFSVVLNLGLGRVKTESLFILHPMIDNAANAILNEVKRDMVDNGVLYPTLSDKLFINNPKNIKNETLNPTDNTNFSVDPILFNFST